MKHSQDLDESHLGSVSLVTDRYGVVVSQARYTPYGELRWPAVSQMPTDFGYTGQRADRFGLMDYNARFYSPHLGRFVSPDTVVPNPGKAVSFDRFAYGDSNPIKYRDPSGHLACDAQNVAEGDCSEKSWTTLQDLIASFGVTLGDGFSLGDMWEILTALRGIGAALSGEIEGNPDLVTAFQTVFGGLNLILDPTISPMDGKSSADLVRLKPGRITARLLGHELGHVFSFRMHRAAGGVYSEKHPEVILKSGLWDGDFFVTGEYRGVNGSEYMRNGLVRGYDSGYDGDTVPDQYHLMSETNPSDYMDDASNDAAEEWADMFLNWSMGGFNDSDRGKYYENWMTTNMSEWISMAGGQ